ncbi:MAG: RNA polymerase sigma factor [Nitrospirales bacterium]|nr:sigma-70 family RNA polymerase sigma factor [Nitrospirales bacterium]
MSETQMTETFWKNESDLFRFLARRLKCAFTARDLTHEIFLKIKGQHDLTQVHNRKAYLFRMAANLATDYLRVEKRRSEIFTEVNDILWERAESRHPERLLIARQELARVEQALTQLPPLSRKIFHLNRFGRKTQREIAREFGVSLATVEAHIRKVLNHLASVRDQ